MEVADSGLRFFPFAAETIGSMAARWPVAICSGALRSEIEYALNRLNCRNQIAAIIAAEDAHKCKPDPAGYLQALEGTSGSHSGHDPVRGRYHCLTPASVWSLRIV